LVFIEVIGVGAGKLEGEAENLMGVGYLYRESIDSYYYIPLYTIWYITIGYILSYFIFC
jgi:hypothetical protein